MSGVPEAMAAGADADDDGDNEEDVAATVDVVNRDRGPVRTQYLVPAVSIQLLTAGLLCRNCATVIPLAAARFAHESPVFAVTSCVQTLLGSSAMLSPRTPAPVWAAKKRTKNTTERPTMGAILEIDGQW